MSFFGFGNATKSSTEAKSTSVSFGANLPVGNKALSAEISEVGQKFVKTNKKYRDEIDKYKKIADFNKKLSSSYIANVHAIIDVSKLLNDYALFFNILKEEINKTEGQIGTLQSSDIQYLENLTKAKMEEFSHKFIEQSEKVRGLYTKYGQESEAKTISSAQEQLKNTISNAGVTYNSLINETRKTDGDIRKSEGQSSKSSTSFFGGSKKKRVTASKKRVTTSKTKKSNLK